MEDKNDGIIEPLPCKICQSTCRKHLLSCPELTIGTRDEFEYLYCRDCGSLSIKDIPNDLEHYYSQYPNLDESPVNINFFLTFLYKYCIFNTNFYSKFLLKMDQSYCGLKLKSICNLPITKNSKILDIGCGNGEFIKHLSKLGFNHLVGIDPFLRDSNILDEKKIQLRRGEIFDINEKYDLITMHHSFEHMKEHRKILLKISSLLKPNALCIIRIPNIESISFNLYQQLWEGIHAPFHFALPSSKGMEVLTRDIDLQLAKKSWEHPHQLTFFNINRKMGIADFDSLGARRFLTTKPFWRSTPPLFTRKKVREIKKQANLISRTQFTDYVCYYYQKI